MSETPKYPIQRTDGWYFCALCWRVADEGHLTGATHAPHTTTGEVQWAIPEDASQGRQATPNFAEGSPSAQPDGSENTDCIICMAAPRIIAFGPCGHKCVCVVLRAHDAQRQQVPLLPRANPEPLEGKRSISGALVDAQNLEHANPVVVHAQYPFPPLLLLLLLLRWWMLRTWNMQTLLLFMLSSSSSPRSTTTLQFPRRPSRFDLFTMLLCYATMLLC